jgi:hypothetical protein
MMSKIFKFTRCVWDVEHLHIWPAVPVRAQPQDLGQRGHTLHRSVLHPLLTQYTVLWIRVSGYTTLRTGTVHKNPQLGCDTQRTAFYIK